MVGTLWFSRKARSVTKTTLDLSRQDAGKERFESSAVARSLVGNAIGISNIFSDEFSKQGINAIRNSVIVGSFNHDFASFAAGGNPISLFS